MNIYMRLHELVLKNQEMVVATIVDTAGSTPGRRAFKMIVLPDGSTEGTVGGGALEEMVCKRARQCLEEGRNHFEELNLEKIGMQCGGQVKIFYEYMAKQKNFYIFGGGHICQAMTPIAAAAGFTVNIVDNRKEITDAALHPQAKKVTCGEYREVIPQLEIKSPCAALVVSHKHIHDGEILRELLLRNEEFDYIGMIGSRKKVRGIFEKLIAEGISKSKIDRVYSPVGIDIGADTPFEIAISIMAEMIALEKGKNVPHMKIDLRESES